MKMGVDKWRRHQLAGRIERFPSLACDAGRNFGDAPIADRDVDFLAAVGQVGIADE
jgi:hypothetical protein